MHSDSIQNTPLICYTCCYRAFLHKTMIEEFDKLRKNIKTDEGKKLAKDFRKILIRSKKYSDKLNTYLSDTLDGMKPEDSARDLGLL